MTVYRNLNIPGYERLLRCADPESGLRAIVAVHDTTLGPALGGCRMWRYDSEDAALADALRLARGMTRKAAVAGLALGGGKAVIIGDPRRGKTPALLRAFGRAVERLDGAYITGEDVGTSVEDMAVVRGETRHVVGLAGASGDPSPVTAAGVRHGIRAAVERRFGAATLSGATVAVQGLGHVGYNLCRLLREDGARLIVADPVARRAARAADEFGAAVVAPDAILDAEADVFAPCALGGAIDAGAPARLKAGAVAGAANNQLADATAGEALHRRGILYAPDYVINAGGLINVSWEILRPGEAYDREAALAEVAAIGPRLASIFERAARLGVAPERIADEMARERLARPTAA